MGANLSVCRGALGRLCANFRMASRSSPHASMCFHSGSCLHTAGGVNVRGSAITVEKLVNSSKAEEASYTRKRNAGTQAAWPSIRGSVRPSRQQTSPRPAMDRPAVPAPADLDGYAASGLPRRGSSPDAGPSSSGTPLPFPVAPVPDRATGRDALRSSLLLPVAAAGDHRRRAASAVPSMIRAIRHARARSSAGIIPGSAQPCYGSYKASRLSHLSTPASRHTGRGRR